MDNRLFFSATQRNWKPIEEVLSAYLPSQGTVLEVASGSGEHAVRFQKSFPQIEWQSSDPNLLHRQSISAWIRFEDLRKSMPEPLNINVESPTWSIPKRIRLTIKAVIAINLIHVTPWSCTCSLFQGASKLLKKGSPLIIYGPFKVNGLHTSKNNELFEQCLKDKNKSWGVHDIKDLNEVANKNGFLNSSCIEMPATNLSLIFHSS